MVHRQRVARGALFAVRGNHRDIPDAFSGAHEAVKPERQKSVVVGAE
jgi:hypothetical protein